jgi:hypothetical protein
MSKFEKLLEILEIEPKTYLKLARHRANLKGYNPNLLNFSTNKMNKLNYNGTNFGSSINKDFLIYSLLYKRGLFDKEAILKKRKAYKARAHDVMIKTNNKESPASLSYNILW